MPDGLRERDKQIIAYATKLTEFPDAMVQADIDALRAQSLSDQAILELNLVVAYMNFVNRIASGLGVELEENLEAYTR